MATDRLMVLKLYAGLSLSDAKTAFCADMVEVALELADGHHQNAANILGIHRNTLTRTMDAAGRPLEQRGGRKGNGRYDRTGGKEGRSELHA